jgi:hypothetical protein
MTDQGTPISYQEVGRSEAVPYLSEVPVANLLVGHPEWLMMHTSSTKAPAAAVNDAVDACIYGFPLVTLDTTRKQMTNVDSPGPRRAPMGQFVRMRTYPTAEYRDVPGANTDTLYTTVWLDVSKETWILSIPDMGDRATT